MKRTLILLIIISLFLCRCSKRNTFYEATNPIDTTALPVIEETEASKPDTTNETEEILTTYEQLPMVAVSLPLTTEHVTSGEETVFYYTYQNIFLNVQDQQVADAIILDYLNRLSINHSTSESLSKDALGSFTNSKNWNPHFFESIFSPTRTDPGVLSLFGHNAIYTGGNHPELECISANYNMVTGEVLTLGSILCNENSIEPLCKLVIERMDTLKESHYLFSDYAETVQQRFTREASYDEDWYFSTNGLCFFFAPYEVAPYTSGIVTVEIPYSDLPSIISDDFFPGETDNSTGTILAERFADADIEDYTQIADVPLSEVGAQVFLTCDGIARNVRLDFGSWNEDGTVFTEKATVFSSYILSPGDGIVVTTDIPDTMPTLRLSYDSGEEHIIRFITQSGKDGTILLWENGI